MSTRVEISKRSVLVNSTSAMAANLLNISVLIWLQQFLLRRISAEEYALYPLLMALMVFVPLISTLLTGGLGRFVVEAYAVGDERRVTEIVSTVFHTVAIVGFGIAALGVVFAWFVDVYMDVSADLINDARIMLALLALSAGVRLALSPFSIGLYVRQRFVAINVLALLTQVIRLSLLATLLFGVSSRVLWVVVATVAANLVTLAITVVMSVREMPSLKYRRSLVNYRSIGEVVSFNTWNFVAHLTGLAARAADPWILHKFAGAADVACMYLGFLAYDRVDSSSVVATQTLQPALTSLHATGDTRRLGIAFLRGSRYGLWMIMLMATPVMVFHRELIGLYLPAEYSAAGLVMLLIFAQFPITYSTLLLPRIVEATARYRLFTTYSVVANALTFGLSFYLVAYRGYGAIGPAISHLVFTVISQPFVVVLAWRLSGVSARQWFYESVWLGLMPALAGAAVWLPLKLIIRADSWFLLGASFVAGALVYVGVLLAAAMRTDERADLQRLFSRVGVRLRPPPVRPGV